MGVFNNDLVRAAVISALLSLSPLCSRHQPSQSETFEQRHFMTKFSLLAIASLLALTVPTSPPVLAAQSEVTFSVTGGCTTFVDIHGAYQVSPLNPKCYLTLSNRIGKTPRNIQLQTLKKSKWVVEKSISLKPKGQEKITIDTSCTQKDRKCAGLHKYRIQVLKQFSSPTFTLGNFDIRFADMDPSDSNLSSDTSLSSFRVNGSTVYDGSLIELQPGTTSVSVISTPTNSAASVVVLGSDNLKAGSNSLQVIVTAANGTVRRNYRIILVVPELSTDTSLSILRVNGTNVSDGQTIQLPSGTKAVSVNAVANKAEATVIVTGGVNLQAGLNNLQVLVTAQDGITQRTYKITLNVQVLDYTSRIRDFFYDLQQAGGSMAFIDAHTDPKYFDKSNPLWASRVALLSKYHKSIVEAPVLASIVETPNWRWGAGTCHPLMTSQPVGHTYLLTVSITESSDIEDAVTSQRELHITLADDGAVYIYIDLCMQNFGDTVLLDKTKVEQTIRDGVLSQAKVNVTPLCPDPLYGKVGQTKLCYFSYNSVFYIVDVTIQTLAGDIIWRTHQ